MWILHRGESMGNEPVHSRLFQNLVNLFHQESLFILANVAGMAIFERFRELDGGIMECIFGFVLEIVVFDHRVHNAFLFSRVGLRIFYDRGFSGRDNRVEMFGID